MLRFVFNDIFDDMVEFDTALAFTMNMDENVPADSMTAVFAYIDCNELKNVRVYSNDKLVFKGVVDEQQTIKNTSGSMIKVSCRSMAAKLLDSESIPISYTDPSLKIITDNHVSEYDVLCCIDEDIVYNGTQVVKKGDSNYKVLENFFLNTYGKNPRISSTGELCSVNSSKDTVVFSNTADGIEYSEIAVCKKRSEEISTIKVKLTNSGSYSTIVKSDDAVSRGIDTVRYINAVLNDTPLSCADAMIKNSMDKSFYITLECAGEHIDVFLKNAVVSDSVYKGKDSLYVSSLRYMLSCDKEVTRLTLKRKDGSGVVD